MDEAFQTVLRELDAKRDELRCSRSGAFYRGHSGSTFRLVPALLRGLAERDADFRLFEVEHNLFHECSARSRHLFADQASSWEILSTLQHHGAPTRLLDWTESFAIAVFFALADDRPEPHVWIVNAFLLNYRATRFGSRPRIPLLGYDKVPGYAEAFVATEGGVDWPYKKPLFVQIPWGNDRANAQRGFFTIHWDERPLEATCPRWTRKVEIPEEAIPGARKLLEISGINPYSVFPDLEGLAQFLRDRYRL